MHDAHMFLSNGIHCKDVQDIIFNYRVYCITPLLLKHTSLASLIMSIITLHAHMNLISVGHEFFQIYTPINTSGPQICEVSLLVLVHRNPENRFLVITFDWSVLRT